MNILVFEDDKVLQLYPITVGRAAYAITCASYQLVDLLRELGGPIVAHVRPHMSAIQKLDYPDFKPELDVTETLTLVVNARLAPSRNNYQRLKELFSIDKPSVLMDGDSVAFAVVETSSLVASLETDADLQKAISNLPTDGAKTENCLFNFPHDVIRENMDCFNDNMQMRLESGQYTEVADGVFSATKVELPPNVIFDTSDGPIVFENNVSLGPFSFLRGPVYIGENCKVNEHASIKDGVSLSHTIKVGGEVEGVVVEAYSNKQHYGFLGHSYLGSWINLGAGTCNSDLKNTYGLVNIDYENVGSGAGKISTGMQFVGCAIGDYAKTAINTSIFTGKMIGVGSMLYGYVTSNVPSFVNYAKSFGQMTAMPADVLVTTQKRMFGRRKVPQRPEDIQLVHDMFELTKNQRPQLSSDPITF